MGEIQYKGGQSKNTVVISRQLFIRGLRGTDKLPTLALFCYSQCEIKHASCAANLSVPS
jgi:hypothetical protein